MTDDEALLLGLLILWGGTFGFGLLLTTAVFL